MSLNLPSPVAAYFHADRDDIEAVAHCFTDNALVKDEGHTFNGSLPSKNGGQAPRKNTLTQASLSHPRRWGVGPSSPAD